MIIILGYVLAFVATVLLVQTVAGLVFNLGDRTRRVNRRLELLDSGMSRDEVFESLLRRRAKNTVSDAVPALYDRLTLYFRQAGILMSPTRFVIVLAVIAAVLVVVGLIVLSMIHRGAGSGVMNLFIAILGAVGLAGIGGTLWLQRRRRMRLRALDTQLPMALDITIRALRAGHPVIMAMKLAAEESADPIGSEFGLIVDETNYGMEFRDALKNFAHRTGSEYAHFFAVCVSIQTETGGNLAEVLGNLSSVIRDMQTLHLRVNALAAEGKMSANVLTVLPIGLVCFLMITQPDFYTSKFGDPVFLALRGRSLVLFLMGEFIMNRMVNFKY